MKNLIKNQITRTTIVVTTIALCVLGIYGGLTSLKEAFSASEPAYYRYTNRSYSSSYGIYLDGSKKSDVGYMHIQGKDSSGGNVGGTLYVFCGNLGKKLRAAENKKFYKRDLNEYYSSKSEDWRKKLSNIVVLYNANSKDSLSSLKTYLNTNYADAYASNGWANLTTYETDVAFQSAIWYYTNNKTVTKVSTGDDARNARIKSLYDLIVQKETALINIQNGVDTSILFEKNGEITQSGDHFEIKYKASANVTNESISLTIKTGKGTTIPSDKYNLSVSGSNVTVAFASDALTLDSGTGSLKYGSEVVDTIGSSIKYTVSQDKNAYVYVNEDSGWQNLFRGETATKYTVTDLVASFTNYKVQLSVDKIDEDKQDSTNLSNATLELYKVDGTAETLVGRWISSDQPKTFTNLAPGKYKVKELDYPDGYSKGTKTKKTENSDIYVKASEEFELKAESADASYNVHIYNKKNEFKVLKVDTDGSTALGGARLAIIDESGAILWEFESDATAISIKEGDMGGTALESGTYYVVELEAPVNYVAENVAYRFAIGEEKDTSTTKIASPNDTRPEAHEGETQPEANSIDFSNYTIKDATTSTDGGVLLVKIKNKKGLSFSKRSLTDNSVCVDGAQLSIKNSSGEEVDSWTSDCSKDNGSHVVTKSLADGTYTFTETVPAPGYASAESIEFTIEDGVIKSGNTIMYDAPLDVRVYKVSTNTSKLLAGAEFTLYDENEQIVTTFVTTNDAYKIPLDCKLEVGKRYILVETKAPKGYKKAANYTFEVKDTGDEQAIEINDEIIIDETASSTSIVIYVSVMIMGLLGVGMVCSYVKKYNY